MNFSINSTALKFSILETTLRHVIKNSLPKCSGSETILSKHKEEQLVGYCKNMQMLGEKPLAPEIFFLIIHKYFTQNGIELLKINLKFLGKEIKILKNENESLKCKHKLISKELETFNNPDTCLLKIVLKYPASCLSLQPNKPDPTKLEKTEELARTKVKNMKRKKEVAAQK
ncbi:24334_t:CDS:2 [Cetraspora pellucida]|uniref:24334_t:CDS:1 n=1 Tax=Cetraspora pellucida TaxID=1433469 RepID=A0A9N9D2F6_9GLOM|nr:24334_t:CDS:2 [Cetraspora pellucida]